MPTLTRTTTTPSGFELQPAGRTTLLDKIYIGFVKDTKDVAKMGRLKVFIPEIGGDPNKSESWLTVSYASPFAGATSAYANTNGNNYLDSQRSYGMWFVPPDLDNEILCCFVNGDPGKGYWFACLWQQNMNHMVPGIPGNDSSNGLPVGEYNKQKQDINPDKPDRPEYAILAEQLKKQGLEKDTSRGVSTSGARRDSPAMSIYGMLTPGGSQIVFDDNPAGKFIRLRTQSGAQVLVNDTDGFVYINSKDGNNWIELSNNGQIDIYGHSDISIRSESSLNIRADLDVNIEAGRSIYMKARQDPDIADAKDGGGMLMMSANVDIHMFAESNIHSTAKADLHRTAGGDIYDYATGDGNYKAGSSLSLQADDKNLNLKGGGEIHATATNIHLNSVNADDAEAADDATVRGDTQRQDRRMENSTTFKALMRNTILYNLPTHEPFQHGAVSATGRSDGTSSDPRTDPDLNLVRKGEIVAGQDKPTNIAGTPRAGMKPGQYRGTGYDDKGNPTYEYVAPLEGLNPASSYKQSTDGKRFLQQLEGNNGGRKYLDPAGNTKNQYSIGYGYLMKPEEVAGNYVMIGNDRVLLDRALTQSEMDRLYSIKIVEYEDAVRKAITAKITQAQYDALVSFTYNTGKGTIAKSSLTQAVNAGDYEKVPWGFMQYKKPSVLIARRQKETSLFLNGDYGFKKATNVTPGNTKVTGTTTTS